MTQRPKGYVPALYYSLLKSLVISCLQSCVVSALLLRRRIHLRRSGAGQPRPPLRRHLPLMLLLLPSRPRNSSPSNCHPTLLPTAK
jgi:hypothetical protein